MDTLSLLIDDPFKCSYNRLTSVWKEFRKAPHCSQVLSSPIGAILGRRNNEMSNTMYDKSYLCKEKAQAAVLSN